VVTFPLVVTACGLAIALIGTQSTLAGIPVWPRVWASAFFIVLFWPVGLALAGRLGGRRASVALAAAFLMASVAQQSGLGSMPLPQQIRLVATLTAPGDAVRQRIVLPAADDRRWQDALRRAHRTAVTVCTWVPVVPDSGVFVSVNGGTSVSLHSLARFGEPDGWGWYMLDVSRDTLLTSTQLDVVVSKDVGAAPAQICGGRDDPRRPGVGGASRRLGGQWQGAILGDPIPGAPASVTPDPTLKRYYVELRLFDSEGHASVGIWY
jgi:hypothetical protein